MEIITLIISAVVQVTLAIGFFCGLQPIPKSDEKGSRFGTRSRETHATEFGFSKP